MDYPQEQIEELKQYCDTLTYFEEGEFPFFKLKGLRLPEVCDPKRCDGLLCPVFREGYPSRLYFSEQIQTPYPRNWNANSRIGEQNWVAFSWTVNIPNPTLCQLLVEHLKGFTKP